MARLSPRVWIIIGLGILVLASFLFSSGFRNTITRRKNIKALKNEMAGVAMEIEKVSFEIKELKSNPKAYEGLIRQELGYLKPGEREIRFVDPKTKKR